jgi:hypothetical protein
MRFVEDGVRWYDRIQGPLLSLRDFREVAESADLWFSSSNALLYPLRCGIVFGGYFNISQNVQLIPSSSNCGIPP